MTTSTPLRAITPAITSTWKNKFFNYCVVQALPRHDDPDRFRREHCRHWRQPVHMFAHEGLVSMKDATKKLATAIVKGDVILNEHDEPTTVTGVWLGEKLFEVGVKVTQCAGTSTQASHGVLLERRDALHAIHAHYLFANQSVCRFRSAAKGEYACDLIFEIDVHAPIEGDVELAWFNPYIEAAVTVGRRIFDHLTNVLEIDAKYITTSVTRMGCRVTVDWRCFGPRRLHQILLVLRHIENQVFGDGELAKLAKLHGVPKIEIDGRIFERSDLPRSGLDESNSFKGSWLRPIGAMHSKSGQGGWWYRTTPISHEMFHANNTATLVNESRGRDHDWRHWPNRKLPNNFLWLVPESRNPKLDPVIEADPRPALNLIELFERDDLVDQLPDDQHHAVVEVQQTSRASRIHVQREFELDADAIEKLVEALDADHHDRPDRWDLNCPRNGCKQRDKKARVFKESGVFKCWRCTEGMSLIALAAELGLSRLIPSRVQSSSPMATMPESDVPAPRHLNDWGDNVELIERTFDDPVDLWTDRQHELDRFRSRKNVRLLVDASDLGTGKSTGVRRFVSQHGIRHRSLVPRDEAKLDYLEEVDGAVAIQGRRLGINCTNERLEEVLDRRESVAKTLCSVCPDRDGCAYRAQFSNIKDSNIILSHAHGGMAHFDVFDNESEIDIVDEDALGAVAQHDDLDADELGRFRIGQTYDFDVLTEEEANVLRDAGYADIVDTVTLDAEARPSGATPVMETTIARLQALLTTDEVLRYDPAAARIGELVDLDLAKYLMSDPELRDALQKLDADDAVEHEIRRIDLVKEFQADVASGEQKLGNRRPKDIIKDLHRALYAVYYVGNTGTNKPLELQAFRTDGGNWVLRLTTRKPFLSNSEKVIHLSATAVPERLRLLHGEPTSSQRWTVYKAHLTKKERRVVIADKTYSRAGIFAKKSELMRTELIETVDKLIDTERDRTKLPVAVIGASRVINWYLEHRLGKIARKYAMPFKGADRADKMLGLRELTLPLGFVAGYAGGVAGSNDFAVDHNGTKRFVRSLIVLGNIIPNLTNVARDHRGLHANIRDEPVDWTQTMRTVAFEGTERGGQVQVAKNVIGYRDQAANAILHGIYEGELLQIVGRMRGQLPDPVDPTIMPTIYMVGSVAIPGWTVDEVITLDDLRGQLGLAVKEGKPRGRKSTETIDQQIQRRWAKQGSTATMKWLVAALFPTKGDMAVTHARLLIQGAGLEFNNSLVAVGNKVVAELEAKRVGKGDPPQIS